VHVVDALALFGINPNIPRYDVLLQHSLYLNNSVNSDFFLTNGKPLSDTTYPNKLFSERLNHRTDRLHNTVMTLSLDHMYNTSSYQQLFWPDSIKLPRYCALPLRDSSRAVKAMTSWARSKLQWKCHHKITSSRCYKVQYVDPFTPCLTSLQAALAEDYAWSMGWCSTTHDSASVPLLPGVQVSASLLQELDGAKSGAGTRRKGKTLRLAVLVTVYKSLPTVMRLLRHIYSPGHVYLINVDTSSPKLAADLRAAVVELGSNIYVACGIPVVYMASSASQILVQGMQWFLHYGGTFDYLISCTGSDYPLLPLRVMENILQRRSPSYPSVMNWNHATWQDAMSTQGSHSVDSRLARDVVMRERRPPHSPMESRGKS
jgi:hypothetical protein